ncbi:T6SS effector BTH_I2691 family protein [Salinicola aestuarinus]|uniref:T6SS effector BTH_I2691 family protein n=1 Tax=Salinicola aestuarinus TaxID=1949082 RepID=UPI000DA1EEA0|nr:T6SS effector BTH_I2691 family protein [Salinicola aestuarinus]
MVAASNTNDHASNGAAGGVEANSCSFCERKGLPILPVRYAVCQRDDRNSQIPELAEERVHEFTDIMLDKTLVNGEEQGRHVSDEVKEALSQSTDSQVNKYILRQLRQGYLYLYDQDSPNQKYWYAYAITSDGKYYQFPVLQPPALDDIEFPESCQTKSGDVLDASVVTLPFPEDSGTLYYAFSEHPWPEAHVHMIGENAAWRDAHMQKVNIPAWVGGQQQPFAFDIDELESVAEYSAGAENLDEQFWRSGPTRPLFEPDELREAMKRRLDHAASEYQGKGFILAVNDEVGIIEELNAYRHQALAEAEAFVSESETNRRKLLCKQAIDALKKNFAKNYLASQEKEKEDAIEAAKTERDELLSEGESDELTARERAMRQRRAGQLTQAVKDAEADRDAFLQERQAQEEACREQRRQLRGEIEELEAVNADHDERLRQQAEAYRAQGRDSAARGIEERRKIGPLDDQIRAKQFQLENVKTEAESAAERHASQLDDLYDSKALDEFYSDYQDRNAICQALLSVHDSDYALWVLKHLDRAIARYSQTDYWMGLGLSGLIGNALRGGILSPASGSVWKTLAEALDSEGSLIMAAMFANNAELVSAAQSVVGSLPVGARLRRETLREWGERVAESQQRSRMPDGRRPTRDQIRNRFEPIQNLVAMTIGNAIASLALYETAGLAVGDMKSPLQRFVQYHQLSFMADPDVQTGDKLVPELVEVEVKLSDLYQLLRAMSRASEPSNERGVDTSRALKSLDGTVGNFSAPLADRERRVRISLPEEIAAVLGAQDDSDESNLLEHYTLEDDQKRQSDLGSNATSLGNTLVTAYKGYGQVAGMCLVLWNLVSTLEADDFIDDEDGADWSKILSTGVGIASSAMGGIEGYKRIRAASLGLSFEGGVIGGRAWTYAGHVMGVVGGLVSVWDGMNKLTESAEATKTGRSLDAQHALILGGFGVVSGIISIIMIGASTGIGLVVSVFFGILALLLGWFFVTMVSPAVQMWINRSIFGKPSEQEDMQILPFEDLASEQSSLEMVFQGVLVDLSWEAVAPDPSKYFTTENSGVLGVSVDSEAREAEEERVSDLVRINLKVRVPKLDGIELVLKLTPKNSPDAIVGWTYQKDSDDEVLTAVSNRGSLPGSELEEPPTFKLKDNSYVADWSHVYAKNLLTQIVALTIYFNSTDSQSFNQDLLAMRI